MTASAALLFASPAAFLLLAALPLLVLLHRRRAKPERVVLPTVRFFEGIEAEPDRAARRLLDGELLLALGAAAAIAWAAAGPALVAPASGRRILIVRDDGPAPATRASDGRTIAERGTRAVEVVRAATSAVDDVTVVVATGVERDRRLRDAGAGLRLLVADRRPADLPSEVVVVGTGDDSSGNAGIVAVDVVFRAGVPHVEATIRNEGRAARRLRVGFPGAESEVEVPGPGAVRIVRPIPPILPATLRLVDDGGASAADDEVVLSAASVAVAFDRGPGSAPEAVLRATRRALDAAFPSAWREVPGPDAELFVGRVDRAPATAAVLELGVAVGAGVSPGEGDEVAPDDPGLAADVDVAALPWVFPSRPAAGAPWRRISTETLGGRLVARWHADPTLGAPPPLDGPAWPIFVENVVRAAIGAPLAGGLRARGVLDPEATRPGRDTTPFDPGTLDRAPVATAARRRSLVPHGAAAAVAALLALWFFGARRAGADGREPSGDGPGLTRPHRGRAVP